MAMSRATLRMAGAADECDAESAEPAAEGMHNEWKARPWSCRWRHQRDRRRRAWAPWRHPSRWRCIDWEVAPIDDRRLERSAKSLGELFDEPSIHRLDRAAVDDVEVGDDLHLRGDTGQRRQPA